MSDSNWMNTPALSGIDPAKLQMLASLAGQAQQKDKNEVLPFLMALSQGGAGTTPGSGTASSASEAASNTASNLASETSSDTASNAASDGTPGNAASGPISFDADETEAIINALKAGKSPQEIRKMDKILSVMKRIRK